MTRRALHLLSFVSLLPLAAVSAMWVRSHFLSDRITDKSLVGTTCFRSELHSGQGVIGVQWFISQWSDTSAARVRALYATHPKVLDMDHRKPWPHPPNFGWVMGGNYREWGPVRFATFGHATVSGPGVQIIAPYWLLCVMAAVPIALSCWRRHRRRRRSRAGRCPQCDYDLRATPDRCPECGAAPRRDVAATIVDLP